MIEFPDSPTTGDTHAAGGALWLWDGTKWTVAGSVDTLTVVSLTADYTVLDIDDGTHFNNLGATADIVVTLPTPAAGLYYAFVVLSAYYIRINGTIMQGGLTNTYIRSSTPGHYLALEAHDSSGWIVSSTVGAWSLGV